MHQNNSSSSSHSYLLGYFFVVALVFSGCSSKSDGTNNANAQLSFDRGVSLLNEGKWQDALDAFENVGETAVLGPDQTGELYAYRALIFAQLNRFHEATVNLGLAKKGSDIELIERISNKIDELRNGNAEYVESAN